MRRVSIFKTVTVLMKHVLLNVVFECLIWFQMKFIFVNYSKPSIHSMKMLLHQVENRLCHTCVKICCGMSHCSFFCVSATRSGAVTMCKVKTTRLIEPAGIGKSVCTIISHIIALLVVCSRKQYFKIKALYRQLLMLLNICRNINQLGNRGLIWLNC